MRIFANISNRLRVAPNDKPGAIREQLPKRAPEEGEPFERILSDVDHIIVPGMVHWSHPMFLGYFGWTSTAPGILGEILTAPLNVNAMTWRTCPAATELETVVIDWLRQWVGLSDEFEGVIYDTASVGIMHALAVAREEAAPATRKLGLTDRNLPRLRIYTSDQAHSSAEKAAIALGLGEENVIRIPSDDQFRIDVNSLGQSIAEDRQNGLQPMAVVATVGTTSTASVDPVRDIGNLCREAKIWLHIDAAYGGGFAMVPEYEWMRKGWELADSIVINPHKTVFVPLDFSVLYVRDLERLRRVFSLVPEYLRGDTVEAEKNYMDYGIQLGRRFRALKAWVIWRSLGRAGVVARLREQIRLANLLADWIKKDDRFELSAQPSMGVVCFRFIGAAAGIVDAGPGHRPRLHGQHRPIEQRHRRANQRVRARVSHANKIARPNSNEDRPRQRAHHRRTSAQGVGDHSGNGKQPVAASLCEAQSPINFNRPSPNDQSATDLTAELRFAWH